MKKTRGIFIIRFWALLSILVIYGFILTNISSAQKKEESKPEIKIDINKKYDDKGNIILYDSSYSYSWKGHGNDIDSILDRIHHHLEIYNFDNNGFFPHSQLFPEFPDFNLEPFFRYSDSVSKQHDHLDTVLKRSFHDDFLNWNFEYDPFDKKSIDSIFENLPFGYYKFPGFPDWHYRPFGPCDSLDLWYEPYEWSFPHSYFEDLEKHLEEIRKYIEEQYGPSAPVPDNFYRNGLKYKYLNKPKKNTCPVKT